MKTLILKNRRWLAESLDLAVAAAALVASFLLRFDFTLEPRYLRMLGEALPWRSRPSWSCSAWRACGIWPGATWDSRTCCALRWPTRGRL